MTRKDDFLKSFSVYFFSVHAGKFEIRRGRSERERFDLWFRCRERRGGGEPKGHD